MNNGAVTRFVVRKLNNMARSFGPRGPRIMAVHARNNGIPVEVALASLRGVRV